MAAAGKMITCTHHACAITHIMAVDERVSSSYGTFAACPGDPLATAESVASSCTYPVELHGVQLGKGLRAETHRQRHVVDHYCLIVPKR